MQIVDTVLLFTRLGLLHALEKRKQKWMETGLLQLIHLDMPTSFKLIIVLDWNSGRSFQCFLFFQTVILAPL